MRIDNLHFHSEPQYRTTSFSLNIEGLEYTNFMKEDGVPWDSMVGIRAIRN